MSIWKRLLTTTAVLASFALPGLAFADDWKREARRERTEWSRQQRTWKRDQAREKREWKRQSNAWKRQMRRDAQRMKRDWKRHEFRHRGRGVAFI